MLLLIEVERLSKRYGSTVVVENVSFTVGRGEVVGFLGPNGAGKSTMMRILVGLLAPTSGTAWVAGYNVVRESLASRGQIGYLPEVVPLYPDMKARDYLCFMAQLRRIPEASSRVEAIASRCGLSGELGEYIGTLSHGYRQRVGLAQALVHDPAVLILDEPTTGLDPVQIVEIRGLIRGLGGEHTILLSTHILAEAEQVCDRVLIIDRGKIVGDSILNRSEQNERAILLRLRRSEPDTAAILATVRGVSSVECTGDEGGYYRLMCASGLHCESEIARVVVENGWELVELSPSGAALEALFLQTIAREER